MKILKNLSSLSLVISFAFVLPYAVNAKDVTDVVDISGFSRIELNTSADLKVKIGKEYSVKVTGDQRRIDRMKFDLSGDKLDISGHSHFSFFRRNGGGYVKIEITMPDLEEIEIDSSGDAEITGLDNKEISLDINSSGNIYVNGKSENVEIEVNGSGDVEMDQLSSKNVKIEVDGTGNVEFNGGACDRLDIEIDGSGDVNARDLICREVRIDVDGSGNSRVYATDNFIYRGDGSGRVDVFGKPKKIEDQTERDSKIRIR